MRLRYRIVEDADLPRYQDQLAAFEAQFRYPLGDGRYFRISHGRDYGAFFRRMGRPRYVLALTPDGRIAGMVVGVRRSVPQPNGRRRDLWYLCDLKVDLDFRGKGVFQRMGWIMLPRFYRYWLGVYFVSMNSKPLSEMLASRSQGLTGVASLLPQRRLPVFGRVRMEAIFFVSVEEEGASRVVPGPREALGAEGWRQRFDVPGCGSFELETLNGIKDLLLEPDLSPLPIVHAGGFERVRPDPEALVTLVQAARAVAAQHGFQQVCFCWSAEDVAVLDALTAAGITTESSGTVYDLYPPFSRRATLPVRTSEV